MSREDRAALGKMAEGVMKMNVTVAETAENKRVVDWNCRRHLQTVETFLGPSNSEVRATEGIKVD